MSSLHYVEHFCLQQQNLNRHCPMPEHLQDMYLAVVNLHIVINLARKLDSKAAVVLHFTVSLSVALSYCQLCSISQ